MSNISLEKHLPRLFLDQLEQFEDTDPFAVRLPAAVMMSDVSGFSTLTHELTRDSARGAETLQVLLDSYFGAIGDIIAAHGGDIATFAGDAVIAVWPAGDDLRTAAKRATQCALKIQQETRARNNGKSAGLTQRIAVSAGELVIAKLGGADGKWLNVFAGQPVIDAGHACDVAKPGDVLITRDVADLLDDDVTGTQFGSGHVCAEKIHKPVSATNASSRHHGGKDLAAYVPDIVARRAARGQGEWLAEFRNVTVMFAKLENIDFNNRELSQFLQQVAIAVQEAVKRFGGALPFALMDDKGLNFVVAFGIPTATYEDDATRALATGLEIQRALRGLGLKPSIGVATGILYCGECGATERRQFSMIGPAINFAARLAGASPDDLLSDEETTKSAGSKLSFTLARNVRPKNTDAGFLTFRPEWREKASTPERAGEMVGRESELARLVQSLARAGDGRGARLLITGEPGIGKSRLLRALNDHAQANGFSVIAASGQSLEQNTPYYIWRDILRVLLQALATVGESSADTVQRLLRGDAQLLQWAPLLNDILPLGFAETPLTAEIRGAARASSIQTLLLRLLEDACLGNRILLVVDDLHWIDALSASALTMLTERLPPLSIVIGSRPTGGSVNMAATEFSNLASLETLALGELDEAQTGEIVGHVCGVASVTPELGRMIHQRSGGNPFYIQQLTLELRESGHIEVVGGRCKLHADIESYIQQVLPKTLRGIVTSRVDRLPDDEQLALKLACVFGRVFSAGALAAIHPVEEERSRVGELLSGLLGSNLISREQTTGATTYEFSHAIVQETLYELLPLAQRRRMHLRIADWIEAEHHGALSGFFSLLANHCIQAEEYPRALNHLEGAAKTAIRHSAYREAIGYVERAQRIATAHSLLSGSERSARWHTLLADSHHEMSEYGNAREHYLRTLELLGLPYAPGNLGRAAGILLNLAKQLLGSEAPRENAAVSESGSLVAHAYARLAEIYYHENNPFSVLHLTLLAVNRAHRAGSIAELSDGYGALAIAFGQAGLAQVGRRYTQRAIGLAERLPGNVNGAAYANLLAMVYASSQCDWEILDRSGERAEALYADLGDGYRLQSARAMTVTGAIQRGRYDVAMAIGEKMAAHPIANSSKRVAGWILANRILTDIVRAKPARGDIEALSLMGESVESLVDRLMFLGAEASAWRSLGEHAGAMRAADRGLELLLGRSPVAGAGYVDGPLGVVEVLLASADHVDPASRAEHEARTDKACRMLRTYASQVPSTRPRGLFLLAVHAERKGARRRAMSLWRRAAATSRTLSMPFHEAAALLALGQRLPAGTREIAEAQALFARLDVPAPRLFFSPDH